MIAKGLILAMIAAQNGEFEGKRIEAVRVEGLRRTKVELVVQQLASRAGEAYAEQKRKLDEQMLDRLGIFSSIRVSPVAEGEGVLLIVDVKETLPIAPYVSASSTQENGLSAGPGIGAINVGGRAVNANVAVEFGGATNVFLRLRSPPLTQPSWRYEAGYQHVLRDNTVFKFVETSQQTDARLGYQFRPDLQLAGRFRFLSLSSREPGMTLSPPGPDRMTSFAPELRYDTRDLWSDPSSGWFVSVEAARTFVSGGGWWTGQFDIRRYQRFADRHTAALFALYTPQSGTPGADLPVYMTYGIGGANTVRGWNTGARIGKHQWLNTLEYRYRLVKLRPLRIFGYNVYWGIHLALYGDLGTAWTAREEFTRNFIGGAGYGVRLVIPYVGTVRFDRAYGNALRPCYGLGERADVWRDRIR